MISSPLPTIFLCFAAVNVVVVRATLTIHWNDTSEFLSPRPKKVSLTFTCDGVPADKKVFITWQLVPTEFKANEQRNELNGKTENLDPEGKGGKLEYTIWDVNPESGGGMYQCSAEAEGAAPEKSANYSIHTAPFIPMSYLRDIKVPRPHLVKDSLTEYTQPSVHTTEGWAAEVSCPIYGFPPVSITWFLVEGDEETPLFGSEKDEGIVLKEDNRTLSFAQVGAAHAAVYKCKAENSPGKEGANTERATIQTQLRVKGKLAALWPSLGIIVEVIALGVIIAFFEYRQKKQDAENTATEPDENAEDDD